jgi:hypothetical protein
MTRVFQKRAARVSHDPSTHIPSKPRTPRRVARVVSGEGGAGYSQVFRWRLRAVRHARHPRRIGSAHPHAVRRPACTPCTPSAHAGSPWMSGCTPRRLWVAPTCQHPCPTRQHAGTPRREPGPADLPERRHAGSFSISRSPPGPCSDMALGGRSDRWNQRLSPGVGCCGGIVCRCNSRYGHVNDGWDNRG